MEKRFLEIPEGLKERVKELGLVDLLDTEYTLKKISSKNHSPYSHDEEYNFIGRLRILGGTDVYGSYASLFIENRSGWLKTSPIMETMKVSNYYLVETENSVYELRPL